MDTDICYSSPVETVAYELIKHNALHVVFAYQSGKLKASHKDASFLLPLLRQSKEWRNHEAVVMKVDPETMCIYIVTIHSTKRGRAEGGARLKVYGNIGSAIDDCLRLSYGMTMKNAVAEIWEGGGKSIIVPFSKSVFDNLMIQQTGDLDSIGADRILLWKNFGEFIAALRGVYIVGEDVNLNSADMAAILRYCVHTSCLDKQHGGSGNPSPHTAHGVYYAARAGTEFVFPNQPLLTGKRVLVKGLGNVGLTLVRFMLSAGAHIIAFDPSGYAKKRALAEFDPAFFSIIDDYDEFISLPADVFSPNSNSLSVNKRDIDKLKVKLICGAENGQLEDIALVSVLSEKGITYIPEMWINYMGVYAAYAEHRGVLKTELEEKSKSIYEQTRNMLAAANMLNIDPYTFVMVVANTKAEQCHPLDGHRGIKIINELFDDWANNEFLLMTKGAVSAR